jgi:regulator of cell morphogenesis and NO signaling
MPTANTLRADDVPTLIAHILERFHDTHRRELPGLVALARELGASGAELAGHLDTMAKALDLHMFKEEMRLFPMIEQGGSPLIGHLIDDLAREHRAHDEAIARLEELLAALHVAPEHVGIAGALRAGVAKLVDDLRQHMHAEDDVLFPPFAAAPRPRASLA